jgi:hypothetical protein
MRLLKFGQDAAEPISAFNSRSAFSVALGTGSGEHHIYSLYFEADSEIGPHPTGFAQLFLVVHGSGWVASADGHRVQIGTNEGAFFEKGEMHSKGSEHGMQVIMIQSEQMSSPQV